MSTRLLRDYHGGERKLEVVWDAGNGAAGPAMAGAGARGCPGAHCLLFAEVDGTLPEPPPRPDGAARTSST